MIDVISGKFQFNSPVLWVDFGISLLILSLVLVSCYRIMTKKLDWILTVVLEVALILFWFFGLKFAWTIAIILNIAICTSIFVNKQFSFGRLFKGQRRKNLAERIYDRKAVAEKVSQAVESLSKTKTGALITFEKQDKLNDVVKSGTILNAPITAELLTTIFYPGTRLHDGAVVIRGDEILAASVYYTPTTKPLTGKYGSRHRAAIGISEKSDSITLIVSEETGRISLAVKGELIPVNHDNILRTLEDYLID